MKKALAAVGAALAIAGAVATRTPPGLCVMRAYGTPKELCLRNGYTVRHNAPFPASEGTKECRPVACDSAVRSVFDSSTRVPLSYDPRTGDIFSVADGGHE